MVLGIGGEVTGVLGVIRSVNLPFGGVFVKGKSGGVEAFDVVAGRLHEAEHVVEAAVLHHQNEKVIDLRGHLVSEGQIDCLEL